ncbi:MAG: HD domain-containing protein [Planctomycetota bacterium]|jgi:tetratricopeptide (TPR) repeat protein
MIDRKATAYQNWHDCRLAKKISEEAHKRLRDVWSKARELYPRATWNEWVDHSESHVLGVLRNLERITPDYVFKDIQETEALVLIAAALLHDIGMSTIEGDQEDLQNLANCRTKHGVEGERLIRRDFSDFLKPVEYVLNPLCEIVRNHHGAFNPQPLVGLGYDLRADALWVRLADELDFGPHRAPSWLIDYVRPEIDQLSHWLMHSQIREPAIDLGLLRIQITGVVESDLLIKKLRLEFEAPERQDLQKIFLSRGLTTPEPNRTFLIWDKTRVQVRPGDDSKEIDARPAIFRNDQFLLGARYLYNLGRYEVARKCFEEGLRRLSGRWSDMPATPYFYHYLKTLNGLGEYKESVRIADQYKDADFSEEINAAVAASNGLAYWKMGCFDEATHCIKMAKKTYSKLSKQDIKHKINEADAWVLHSITHLEQLRASRSIEQRAIEEIEADLERAGQFFSEYAKEKPDVPESHYKGRYFGCLAFFSLLKIEFQDKRNAQRWDKALQYADLAQGGVQQANRNPYGALCGRYCAAAVNYHKYRNSRNDLDRQQALLESVRLVKEVREGYDELFGPAKRITRLWPKINRLFTLIRAALPRASKLRKELSAFYGSDEPAVEIQIYTPLH